MALLFKGMLNAIDSLREKFPDTEFFFGPYFPVFGLNTEICSIISVFSANTGKYELEKTSYLDTFYTMISFKRAFLKVILVRIICSG